MQPSTLGACCYCLQHACMCDQFPYVYAPMCMDTPGMYKCMHINGCKNVTMDDYIIRHRVVQHFIQYMTIHKRLHALAAVGQQQHTFFSALHAQMSEAH